MVASRQSARTGTRPRWSPAAQAAFDRALRTVVEPAQRQAAQSQCPYCGAGWRIAHGPECPLPVLRAWLDRSPFVASFDQELRRRLLAQGGSAGALELLAQESAGRWYAGRVGGLLAWLIQVMQPTME